MKFVEPDQIHLSAAVKLAVRELRTEQRRCPSLIPYDFTDQLERHISAVFQSGFGLVSIERDEVTGYLCFGPKIRRHFGLSDGAFSPLYASAFGGGDRQKTASLLFQEVSKQLLARGLSSFAICKYAHDTEILKSFVFGGFGFRCSDAVRPVNLPAGICPPAGYRYFETAKRPDSLFSLENALLEHLAQSPVYFPHPPITSEQFRRSADLKENRLFIAEASGKPVGYLELCPRAETFISEHSDMLNICGMYFTEAHRGSGAADGLLEFVLQTLRKEGVPYLGVDYETINPNALRFWGKYFDSYTYSFVRRLDERLIAMPQ